MLCIGSYVQVSSQQREFGTRYFSGIGQSSYDPLFACSSAIATAAMALVLLGGTFSRM